MRSSMRVLGIAALGAGLCLAPGVAPAQEDGANPAGIEEIIVTARKREESLQNVPLAITAFDEAAIERTYSADIGDFTKYSPNVSLSAHPYTGNGLLANIRGLSFRDLEKSFDPTVGVVLDGMPLGHIAGARIDAFDLESIEILRGPQGTLFGRNTVGGVVNVRRSRPTGEFGAKVGMRIGDNQETDYKAVVNFPIVPDILSAKLAAFSENDDGFAYNITRNQYDKGIDVLSLQGALLFTPTPNIEALLSLDYMDDASEVTPPLNLTASTGRPFGAGGTFCDFTRDTLTPGITAGVRAFVLANAGANPATPDAQLPPQLLAAVTAAVAAATGPGSVAYNGCRENSYDLSQARGFSITTNARPFKNYIDSSSGTLEVNWDIGDLPGFSDLTFTSISGYRKSDELLDEEQTGGPDIVLGPPGTPPTSLFYVVRDQEHEQWSQEVRAAGSLPSPGFGGGIDLVAGLYYFHSEYSIDADSFALGSQSTANRSSQDADTYAIFGEANWNITKQLNLTVGIRWTYETKEMKIRDTAATRGMPMVRNPATGEMVPNPNYLAGGFSFRGDESWNEATPRVSLDYRLNENLMFYGSYARGFRSGGFVGRAVVEEDAGPFKTEVVDNYELGMRSDWWGQRLRFNLTGFYTSYKDRQQILLRAIFGTISTFVDNADATLYGAEAELLLRLGNLNFYANGGWLDTEYDRFITTCSAVCNPSVGKPVFDSSGAPIISKRDLSGLPLTGSPEFNYNVGADWVLPMKVGHITLSANHKWTDSFSQTSFPDPPLNRDQISDYSTTDFSISYTMPYSDGRELQVGAFVKDAFHKEGRISATIPAGIFYFGSLVQGRNWGVEASISF